MVWRERRYDIDWLRVLALLTIFFFHCARFFDHEDWHVKNNQLSFGMSVFVGIVSQWIMPLFFMLSAISAYFALNYRESKPYIHERFKRLIIPLLFGSFIIIAPVQVWIERVTHGQFSGSFIEFYPLYFSGFYAFGGNFAWMGLHLWYLEMLFIFALLTLPIFLYLRQRKMHDFISRLATFFEKPGMIFLLALPVCVAELIVNLQPEGMGRRDFGGWSPLPYLVFFILGYLIALDLRLKQAIEKQRIIAIVLGLVTTTMGYYLLESGYSSRSYGFSFLRAFNSWFWLVGILGFGSKHLNFNNRVLQYINEAVLPFYVLHQTVIVTIGFYIASWNTSVGLKYPFISILSFVVIVALYDLLIKRFNGLRFLFGMRLKKQSPSN
jgi:peptidoglycan/LPS O-acetylase OafA/YrhL